MVLKVIRQDGDNYILKNFTMQLPGQTKIKIAASDVLRYNKTAILQYCCLLWAWGTSRVGAIGWTDRGSGHAGTSVISFTKTQNRALPWYVISSIGVCW
jgi:hypothetical protein